MSKYTKKQWAKAQKDHDAIVAKGDAWDWCTTDSDNAWWVANRDHNVLTSKPGWMQRVLNREGYWRTRDSLGKVFDRLFKELPPSNKSAEDCLSEMESQSTDIQYLTKDEAEELNRKRDMDVNKLTRLNIIVGIIEAHATIEFEKSKIFGGEIVWRDALQEVSSLMGIETKDLLRRLQYSEIAVTFRYNNNDYAYRPNKNDNEWFNGLCKAVARINQIVGTISDITYHLGDYNDLPRPGGRVLDSDYKVYKASKQPSAKNSNTVNDSDALVAMTKVNLVELDPNRTSTCNTGGINLGRDIVDGHNTDGEFMKIATMLDIKSYDKKRLKRAIAKCDVDPSTLLRGINNNMRQMLLNAYNSLPESASAEKDLLMQGEIPYTTIKAAHLIRKIIKMNHDLLVSKDSLTRITLLQELVGEAALINCKYPCGKLVLNTLSHAL